MRTASFISISLLLSVAVHAQTHGTPKQQQYCKEDPQTKIPYSQVVTIDHPAKSTVVPHLRDGGDVKTPGTRFEFIWPAPGPVYRVDYKPEEHVAYATLHFCTKDGNSAKCIGWTNSEGTGFFKITVYWKQPCDSPNP